MKYKEFKKFAKEFPLFSSTYLSFLNESVYSLRNQLRRWEKEGLLIKLRKGLYILNEEDRKFTPSKVFIANQLYSPSYISTEYALGFYDLIPEKVVDVTSVTTRKTYKITNVFGTFIYQHIKKEAFSGFVSLKDENGFPFLIALPEKAVVDFFYLNLENFTEKDVEIFKEGYRFQNLEMISPENIVKFANLFNCKKLLKVVENFLRVREELK